MKCFENLNFITNWVLNSITDFEQKIENKTHLRKRKHSMIKDDILP
jgi:hypothetical protein